jgi:hypothetical protein
MFDPEQDDIYDPYNRVQDTNLHHVDKITPIIGKILDSKPIVIDHQGYVLDGNHRALAARNAGLQSVPVLRPVKAVSEVKQRLDAKCWTGKHKEGTKIKNGVRVNNCVPNESVSEHIVKVKGGYELKSKKTGKNLGKYPTRAGAEKRERQVQYFKHAGESVDLTASDAPRVPALIKFMDKKLSENLRTVFQFVIEFNGDPRMSDLNFRRQVLAVFDKHKPEILHYMLHYIKHSDGDNVKWLAPGMIKIGIDWPELKTIDNALNAKRPDRAVTDNFTESEQTPLDSLFYNASRLLDKNINYVGNVVIALRNDDRINEPEFLPKTIELFEKYKPQIMKYILNDIAKDDNHSYSNVQWLIPRMKKLGIKWPEFKIIQKGITYGLKKSVSEADDLGKFKTISDMMARDFAEHPVRGFYMMLYHLNDLELTVADMPEIKPLVDRVKPDVIRALLQSVKADNDGMNISNVLQILDRMQNCGVNWPEIDKIRQGLQHNRQQTTEGIDEIESERLKFFVNQIQRPLATKTGWEAAQILEDLANVMMSKTYSDNRFTDQDYAEAAAVLNLNNHKDVLIKGILENIKQNIKNGNSTTWLAENLAMQKHILNKLGCNWPELDRIAAAVAHNVN